MPSLDVFSFVFTAFHQTDPYEDIVEDLHHDMAAWNDALKFHEGNLVSIEDIRKMPYKPEKEMVMAPVTHGDTTVLRKRSKASRPTTYVLPSCPDVVLTDPFPQFFAELRGWQEATYRIASMNTALAYIALSRNTPSGSHDDILTHRILGAMLQDIKAFPSPPLRPYTLAVCQPGDREVVNAPTRMIFDEPNLSRTIASLDVSSRDYLASVAKRVRSNGPAVPRFLARPKALPAKGVWEKSAASKNSGMAKRALE